RPKENEVALMNVEQRVAAWAGDALSTVRGVQRQSAPAIRAIELTPLHLAQLVSRRLRFDGELEFIKRHLAANVDRRRIIAIIERGKFRVRPGTIDIAIRRAGIEAVGNLTLGTENARFAFLRDGQRTRS